MGELEDGKENSISNNTTMEKEYETRRKQFGVLGEAEKAAVLVGVANTHAIWTQHV